MRVRGHIPEYMHKKVILGCALKTFRLQIFFACRMGFKMYAYEAIDKNRGTEQ
jgi:hypothetical protein